MPNAKTIRKAFFEDPGLFFYIVDANHHFVVQAKIARNKHVDEDSDVSKAYEKWKKKFSIDERRIQYGEEFPLLEDELR